jgi:Leucine-rich repeat (LRR) protein
MYISEQIGNENPNIKDVDLLLKSPQAQAAINIIKKVQTLMQVIICFTTFLLVYNPKTESIMSITANIKRDTLITIM